MIELMLFQIFILPAKLFYMLNLNDVLWRGKTSLQYLIDTESLLLLTVNNIYGLWAIDLLFHLNAMIYYVHVQ